MCQDQHGQRLDMIEERLGRIETALSGLVDIEAGQGEAVAMLEFVVTRMLDDAGCTTSAPQEMEKSGT